MIKNPFPGPQPYRSTDRKLFFGRDDLARKLEAVILATRCITVHGPSGAGKSSLVQAAVLPSLVESRDVRVVRVDAWPEGEAPDSWLAQAVFSNLRLGSVPSDTSPTEAVLQAAKRAARASDRLVIIYLDQIEQLFYAGRRSEDTESFFAALQALADLPLRSLRLVLSLREDYLGRFRDRLRDRGRVLENTFRVGPLTVEDLTAAVCQAASAGEPPQEWSRDAMRTLMLQVRVPGQTAADDAEAQAAYAQIVCRALFQERALGAKGAEGDPKPQMFNLGQVADDDAIEAEPILRRYLEMTLSSLDSLKERARRLLEDHLVSADGSRTLRTEKELLRILPEEQLFPILKALEGAAILHAAEHQGSRYFEIGHDWLARKLFEDRQSREAQEEQRKRDEEKQIEFEKQQKEIADRLEKERKDRQLYMLLAGGAVLFSVVAGALGLNAWRAQQAAEASRREATKAQLEAVRKRIEASDQRLLAGYAALTSQGVPSRAIKLLPEVKFPGLRPGWLSVASDALSDNTLQVTLFGHTGPLVAAQFSPDGKRVLTAAADGVARIWRADGDGVPVVLAGHRDGIHSATWSPDGTRILTTSADGTARIWSADGKGSPVEIKMESGPLWDGAFDPASKRVVLGGQDGAARVVLADGSGTPLALAVPGEKSALRAVAFFPDNQRVVAAANNGSVHLWALDAHDKPVEIGNHDHPIESLSVNTDGTKLLYTAGGNSAKLILLKENNVEKPRQLSCDQGQAIHSAISPDGSLVAVSCNDRRVRIFSTIDDRAPVILEGATSFITDLAFRPDGKFIAVASRDGVARAYSVLGGPARLEFRGHTGAIGKISFSPDGKRLVTAASDDRSADYTAKVWRTSSLDFLAHMRTIVAVHAIAIRKDGQFAAGAFDDNTVRIRRVDGQEGLVELKGHTGWISRISWAPEGDRVVTASFDNTARIWQRDGTGEPIILGGQTNDGHTGGLHYAAFSPDGERVVTASDDRTAKVWRASQSDKPIATLGGHGDWVSCAVFSPDGKRIATASHDQNVRIFSANGSGSPETFGGHLGGVNSVMFSPDGERLASASDDGTVRVFSLKDKAMPTVLSGSGTGMMFMAVWSSDGKRIAAVSSDRLVYLWDSDGKSEPSVLTPTQSVIALKFMDGDQSLLAIFADGTTREWRIDIPGLLNALQSANGDCLPAATRRQYLEETEECAVYAYELCESDHERRAAPPRLEQCERNSVMAELVQLSKAVDADLQETKGDDNRWLLGWLNPENGKPVPTVPPQTVMRRKSLQDLGPDGRHVKLVVLPGDADVEIDGSPVARKDGAVELLGKRGDVVRVRASKGSKFVEADVKIDDTSALPPLVVLPPGDAPIPSPSGP